MARMLLTPRLPLAPTPAFAAAPGLPRFLCFLCAASFVAAVGCSKSAPPSEQTTTATAAASVAMPGSSASAQPKAEMAMANLTAKSVKATFLIDAPLEKIKGVSEEGEGSIALMADDLGKTTGTLKIKLTSLRTETFGDKGKDESQTDHARAWMEVGKESSAETRAKYEYAVFKLTGVKAEPKNLADVKEEGGVRKITVTASGDLTLHGVTVKREVPLVATFRGPADKPTEVSFTTEKPFTISLQEHDIKPRDSVGKFLDGALGKIGKKIDDKVQLSLEAKFAP
jgi:polyisoprenoid-binding protein YceI